jgi:hypothetical protein
MAIYLAKYYPLCSTPNGGHAARRYNIPPFVDGSCRREPDLEATSVPAKMKTKPQSHIAVSLLIGFCGCAAPKFPISFESDPPGARIFYSAAPIEKSATSQEYLGITPFTWEIEGNGDRTFNAPRIPVMSEFVRPVVIFSAKPISNVPGLFPQRQVFHSPAFFQPGDKIPAKMFFDLHQQPAENKQ